LILGRVLSLGERLAEMLRPDVVRLRDLLGPELLGVGDVLRSGRRLGNGASNRKLR
jgi:hypothetical protein